MLVLIIAGILGCTAMRPEATSSSIVPIADVSAIVGKWEGTLKRVPGILPIGRVRLTIDEHATYVFSNDGLSDIVVGAGRLMIKNGKLMSDEAGRHLTFILHEKNGT